MLNDGCKDTNKREQKQARLHFAEREYLRQSQRYEKSSAEANQRFDYASDGVSENASCHRAAGEDWHRKRCVFVRDSNHIFVFHNENMWNDGRVSEVLACCLPRRRVCEFIFGGCGRLRTTFSVFGVLFADGGRSATAVRRSGAAANCAAQRAAGGVNGNHFVKPSAIELARIAEARNGRMKFKVFGAQPAGTAT